MLDPEGADVTLFDRVARHDRQPESFAELGGESRFSGSLPSGYYDAFWFVTHVLVETLDMSYPATVSRAFNFIYNRGSVFIFKGRYKQ